MKYFLYLATFVHCHNGFIKECSKRRVFSQSVCNKPNTVSPYLNNLFEKHKIDYIKFFLNTAYWFYNENMFLLTLHWEYSIVDGTYWLFMSKVDIDSFNSRFTTCDVSFENVSFWTLFWYTLKYGLWGEESVNSLDVYVPFLSAIILHIIQKNYQNMLH